MILNFNSSAVLSLAKRHSQMIPRRWLATTTSCIRGIVGKPVSSMVVATQRHNETRPFSLFERYISSDPDRCNFYQRHRRSFVSTTADITVVINDDNKETISSKTTTADIDEQQMGAWAILAALEKSKEAELVAAAKLVSLLETLLPRRTMSFVAADMESSAASVEQNNASFFSLPDIAARVKISSGATTDSDSANGDAKGVTGDDVRALLKATRQGKVINLHTVRALIEGATMHLRTRRPDRLVTIPPLRYGQQLTVIGDLHGSLSDLAAVLALIAGGEPHEDNLLLFNGDLADRGDNGVEIICIVCALCLAYPDFVYINRGNHEDLALSVAYGLVTEIRTKYGPISAIRKTLKHTLDAFYRSLPLATIIENDALIVHAGPPPPEFTGRLADILHEENNPILAGEGLSRTTADEDGMITPEIKKGQVIIESLLWSDPMVYQNEEVMEDYCNTNFDTNNDKPLGWVPNVSRGAGYKFDADIVRKVLRKEGLTRLVRSHQPVRLGCIRYEICDNENDKSPMELFTVFSASRYPSKEGFNQGGILELKANGKHRIQRFATEDDEPIKSTGDLAWLASFHDESTSNEQCTIDTGSIRRILFEAVGHHRGTILKSLQLASKETQHSQERATVPFDKVLDILIEILNLDNEKDLKSLGAKTVLAKALEIECQDTQLPPTDVDLKKISMIITSGRGGDADSKITAFDSYPWLYSVFDIIDEDHDGYISHSEWLHAVARINSGFQGLQAIDAENTWKLLDANEDGQVSIPEWERLAKVMDSEQLEKYGNLRKTDK